MMTQTAHYPKAQIDDFIAELERENALGKACPANAMTYIPSGSDAPEWKNAASQYRHLTQQIERIDELSKDLKARRAQYLDTMKDLMGEASSADHDGVRITKFTVKGSIDYMRIIREQDLHPAYVESFRKASSVRYRVTLAVEA